MWKKLLSGRVQSISARTLACLRHANPTPANTALHLTRMAFGAQPRRGWPAIFGRRVSRKAALHSDWRLGLAVVVVVAALAIPVLSLLWACVESPSAPISRRDVQLVSVKQSHERPHVALLASVLYPCLSG